MPRCFYQEGVAKLALFGSNFVAAARRNRFGHTLLSLWPVPEQTKKKMLISAAPPGIDSHAYPELIDGFTAVIYIHVSIGTKELNSK